MYGVDWIGVEWRGGYELLVCVRLRRKGEGLRGGRREGGLNVLDRRQVGFGLDKGRGGRRVLDQGR